MIFEGDKKSFLKAGGKLKNHADASDDERAARKGGKDRKFRDGAPKDRKFRDNDSKERRFIPCCLFYHFLHLFSRLFFRSNKKLETTTSK